ncbi:carbohydrate porin [Aeromonas schubertii]
MGLCNWSGIRISYLDGKPGFYNLLVGYTNKDEVDFKRINPGDVVQGKVSEKSDNYALAVGASQFLWGVKAAGRYDGQFVGFGPFMRAGVAPDDRSAIDQFYSVGIGGNGGFANRVNDNWGIGWAGTHYSKYLRRDIEFVEGVLGNNLQLDGFEHIYEAYYNLALTPSTRISFNAQYIQSSIESADDPVVLGTRLQIDL